jgi:hypothetical protein
MRTPIPLPLRSSPPADGHRRAALRRADERRATRRRRPRVRRRSPQDLQASSLLNPTPRPHFYGLFLACLGFRRPWLGLRFAWHGMVRVRDFVAWLLSLACPGLGLLGLSWFLLQPVHGCFGSCLACSCSNQSMIAADLAWLRLCRF